MKKAIITVGVSASGKSTFAQKECRGWGIVNRDICRDFFHKLDDSSGSPFSWKSWKWKNEDRVAKMWESDLMLYIRNGENFIVADTNLDRQKTEALKKRIEEHGYEVEIKVFEITLEEAILRDKSRGGWAVGPFVIGEQMQKFVENGWGKASKVERVRSLSKTAIVDIDGTVALMNGRSPFEWNRVGEDLPNAPVVACVKGLMLSGYQIIFVSGRDGVCFHETRRWLEKVFPQLDDFDDFRLLMRAEGDTRDDRIVKEEIFFNHINGNFNVDVVVDDRPKVCNMWRSLGLNVIQVADPFIEF